MKSTILGTISTALGTIGITLAQSGFCFCNIATFTTVLGTLSILYSFITKYSLVFVSIGAFLLTTSIIFYHKKPVCKIHQK